MLRRPPSRSTAPAPTPIDAVLATSAALGIDPSELPDFLTTDPIDVPDEPEVPPARWNRPFASGRAPSDVLLERAEAERIAAAAGLTPSELPDFLFGNETPPPPPTDLPVGAGRRGNRSVR